MTIRFRVLIFGLLIGCPASAPKDEHLKAADALFEKQDFKAAAGEYDLSLQAHPSTDPELWKKGAFAFMKAGNYDKAAQLLLKTVELATTPAGKAEAYSNIAGMYLDPGNLPDKAEQYFGEVMKVDPKNEEALNWLAEISSQLGGARQGIAAPVPAQLDKALARYDELLKLNPKRAEAWANKRIAAVKYLQALSAKAPGTPSDPAELKAKTDQIQAVMNECNQKLAEFAKGAAKPK